MIMITVCSMYCILWWWDWIIDFLPIWQISTKIIIKFWFCFSVQKRIHCKSKSNGNIHINQTAAISIRIHFIKTHEFINECFGMNGETTATAPTVTWAIVNMECHIAFFDIFLNGFIHYNL